MHISETVEAFERWAKSLFARPYIARLVIVMALLCCVWFWIHPPLPGVAIAVLGATAAIVTFGEMQGTHKLLATVAIFALMGVEINDIRKDRMESDRQAAEQRRLDRESFNKIANGIDSSIEQNRLHFETTMSEIEPTLDASRGAVENTRPRAVLMFGQTDPLTANVIATGNKFGFNMNYTNTGNAIATKTAWAAKVYIGKLDDEATIHNILDDFQSAWNSGDRNKKNMTVGLGDPAFNTFYSDILTERQSMDLSSGSATVYLMARLSWVDDTGTWLSDYCVAYQDIRHDWQVGHPCLQRGHLISRTRYAGK